MFNTITPNFTTGRKKIFCYEDSLNAYNVKNVVKTALPVHQANVREIEWLFQLYRGKDSQIESRTREGLNEDINYQAMVNYYSLIADYKANLFLQNPMVYTNVDGSERVSDALVELNKIHRNNNKYARDKTVAIHAAVCGVGYRFVEQDPRSMINDSVINPTNTFSLWGDDTDDKAMAKVYITQIRDGASATGEDITQQTGSYQIGLKNQYTVYTDQWIYRWTDNDDEDEPAEVVKAMPWGIPIIEYKLNPFYIGSFERVTNLIHLLSVLRSDGVNGVVQSIAGFILGKNVGLPMDDENDTEEERKKKEEVRALFRKQLKQYRQIWAEDSKENPVSIDYIGTELFNADIDVLYRGIKEDIVHITSTPSSAMGIGGSGNVGAAEAATGMTQALESAKNAEPYWFESAREQARVELDILHYQDILTNLSIFDIDFALQRAIAEDKVSASQAYATLINTGVKPSDAAKFAGLTPDPESWEKRVVDWASEMEKKELERRELYGREEESRSEESGSRGKTENGSEKSGNEGKAKNESEESGNGEGRNEEKE